MKKRRISAFNAKKKALFNEKKAHFKAKKAQFRKSKLSVSLAWANILTQALFPMGIAFTPAVMAETSDRKRVSASTASKGEQQTATAATRLAGVLSSNDAAQSAESMARGIVTSKGNQEVEQWLNQFGSSKVQLNLDDKMNLNGSQVDALFALEDTPSALLFSQMGVRVHEDDNDLTVNLGVGKRHFFEHQTFGYNVFLDRDIDGQHTRGGLGAEYMRDNLRLSTNSYLSLGGWKNSHHLDGYDEKAANGFDVRAEGYLPSMPQLGGKLMYEKYFGDNVGLFGKDKLQKDPSAITLGVNYTPIPLITMGVDRKQGNSGVGDTHFNLSFNYAFGTPFSKQISASNVAAKRSLAGSRYDLVDRNNEIVLQYQEQTPLKVSLPATLQGSAGQALSLQVQIYSKNGIDRYEWDDALLTAAKGKIIGSGDNWQVVLPSYSFGGNNSYPVSLVVYDKAGNKSQVAQTMVTVTGYGINGQYSTLQSSKSTMVADKLSTTTIELVLNDANQKPISGIADHIQFVTEQASAAAPVAALASRQSKAIIPGKQPHTLSNITELKEKPGTYQATLTSGSEPGMITITAKVDNTVLGSISSKVMLTSIMDTANIDTNGLKANNDGNTVADGKTSNTVELPVKDANGNPLPGYDVTFVVTDANGNKTTVVVRTDENGVAKLPVTSDKAGKVNVSVSIGGNTSSIDMNFVADSSTATIAEGAFVVVSDGAAANASATNSVRVTVTDAQGNVVPNQTVTFAADNGAIITDSVSTDDQGVATVTLTSPKAGTSQVTATVNGNAFNLDVNFVADSATATIAEGAFVVVNDGAAANGSDTNSVRVTVTDAQGNPVPNQTVTFAADNGATITGSALTDDLGVATVTLTNPKSGTSQVTATVNGQSFNINVKFVADAATATIAEGAFVVVDDGAAANGNATNSVQVTVTDAQGNLVPNHMVTFSADNGATITGSASTNDQGIVTVTLTSPKAGTSQVTATVNGQSFNIDVKFVADTATATIADGAFVVVNDGAAANGTATNSVRVTVTDAQGNPVPNQTVSFAATNGAAIVGSAATDDMGVVTATLSSPKAGVSQVTATVNGKPFNIDVNFVADTTTATIDAGAFVVVNDGAAANGSATNSVRVTVTDAQGNPVPNQTVAFAADNGAIITSSASTNDQGIVTVTLTSPKAGTSQVTATVNGQPFNIDVEFVADTTTATIADGAFVVVNDGAAANGTATNSVRVTVTDAQGNLVPNQTITFAADNGATITGSASTNDQGIATVTLTSPKAGTSKVTATVNGVPFDIDVKFVADTTTATIAAGAFIVVDDGAAANGKATNSVRVTVTDKQGNPVPNQAVTFAADNDATITGTASTNDQGIATVTLTSPKAGTSKVTATVNGNPFNINVNFVADTATATIAEGAFVVVNDGAAANGTATNSVRVTVTDAQGNLVPNQAITFAADNGATIAENASTDDLGKVTVPLSSLKAGTSQVTATVNGQSFNINVKFVADTTTAAIAAGAFVVVDDGRAANGTATNSVRVTVTDKQGNPVPNQVVAFKANNTATITSSASTDAQGVVNVTLTSLKAGTSQVTATVNGKASNVDVSFVADTATAAIASGAFVVVTNGAAANGSATNSVKVTVTDKQGNLVPNQTVTFVADNGATIASSATTNDQGIATITLISTKAGTSQVTATVGGNGQTIATNFVADTATAELTADNFTVEVDGQVSGVGKNKVQVLVTDKYGNPVPNMAVTFAATNSVTISASATKTDSAGKITADLSLANTVGTVSTITATMTNTASVKSVQNATVTFYPDFTKAALNTPTNTTTALSISSGFPTTAFKNANFQLSPHGVAATNTNYDWESSDANVAVSSAGLVTFADNPSGEVTITATWKQDNSKVFTYKFNVGLWVVSSSNAAVSQAAAITACQSAGGRLATSSELASGVSVRGTGSLFAEWGNLGSYSGMVVASTVWTAETGYDFHPADGTVHSVGNATSGYICVK
ncbi:Ig-like domain-containing protein [Serratia sp. UGAL515B_01]|uniref:Ig-like domain-containing protein n=1 Tax=Serratia sp. UGAL515B_01 TaxID=2986763 RepID=UPI002954BAC2|nr:Ig-like domain-containing protein [Serratia sp. UGAL515B_01]WON75741.1 Ig-like domain-containing protein [Serratia sp. UGAL515B_01]